jgi:hypothetical protein
MAAEYPVSLIHEPGSTDGRPLIGTTGGQLASVAVTLGGARAAAEEHALAARHERLR